MRALMVRTSMHTTVRVQCTPSTLASTEYIIMSNRYVGIFGGPENDKTKVQ